MIKLRLPKITLTEERKHEDSGKGAKLVTCIHSAFIQMVIEKSGGMQDAGGRRQVAGNGGRRQEAEGRRQNA